MLTERIDRESKGAICSRSGRQTGQSRYFPGLRGNARGRDIANLYFFTRVYIYFFRKKLQRCFKRTELSAAVLKVEWRVYASGDFPIVIAYVHTDAGKRKRDGKTWRSRHINAFATDRGPVSGFYFRVTFSKRSIVVSSIVIFSNHERII